MSLSILFAYIVATFALSIIPGPNMLLALNNGMTKNRNIVVMGIIGTSLGNILLIAAVSIGLGVMMKTSVMLFSAVKWFGTIYLVWLAIQLWIQKPQVSKLAEKQNKNAGRAFLRSFIVAISNPKALVFFTAFLPQFIDLANPLFIQYAILGFATMTADIVCMVIYAFGGKQAAKFLTERGLKKMNQFCSVLMFSLAALLAIYKRT